MRPDRELHIIVTGESGRGKTFLVRTRLVQKIVGCTLGVFLLLLCGTLCAIQYAGTTSTLRQQVYALHRDLEQAAAASITEQQNTDALRADIKSKEALLKKYHQQLTARQNQHNAKLAESISRLDERSKSIEALINALGVEVQVKDEPEHSGGLFIPLADMQYGEKLLHQTNQYLDILHHTPIGKPIDTVITSKFGPRKDPFNHRRGFHEGIDFRGRTGDKVAATGNGVVRTSAYSKGYGNYIVIQHKNGYRSLYAHLSKRLVKKGKQVTRGQTIGLVGSTGRSTGSHLHYELHQKGKPIDPIKFVQISRLKSP
ncbi:MAG: hypothetical protein CSA33_08510 [Desulfobulbus propionicus]|nr:MAG: hypothetical protein CSA33_08510 [Desulfobulbus propionicus]